MIHVQANIADLKAMIGPLEFEYPVRFYGHFVAIRTSLGAFSYAADNVVFINAVIGRYCSFGNGVNVGLTQHPTESVTTHPFPCENIFGKNYPDYRPLSDFSNLPAAITIEDGVWVGSRALIPGSKPITIGRGAIIAAGAIVTSDVPPYAIVGGNPARLIRFRFAEEISQGLDRTRWWDYDWFAFASGRPAIEPPLSDPAAFLTWWTDAGGEALMRPFLHRPRRHLLSVEGNDLVTRALDGD